MGFGLYLNMSAQNSLILLSLLCYNFDIFTFVTINIYCIMIYKVSCAAKAIRYPYLSIFDTDAVSTSIHFFFPPADATRSKLMRHFEDKSGMTWLYL